MWKTAVYCCIASLLISNNMPQTLARNLFPRPGEGVIASSNHWTYETTTDPTSGLKKSVARLASQNLIVSQEGEAKVVMSLGQTTRGSFVEFNLHDGGWNCLHGCKLRLKIDDASEITVEARLAELTGYLLILPHPAQFIAMLRNTQVIEITVDTLAQPDQIMTFKTSDFQLPPPQD